MHIRIQWSKHSDINGLYPCIYVYTNKNASDVYGTPL